MNIVHYHGEKMTKMPFLFWNKIPEGIKSIEDLGRHSKKPVCVEAGTSQEVVLKKYPNLNLRALDKVIDAIMELRYDKSLTTTTDPALMPRYMEQFSELKILELPLPPSEHVLGYGICMNKASVQLTEQVQKAVDDMKKEGKIAALERKWKLIK
jgi:arginine transport system substrate-binding protein